jgi:hypothetical protein
MAFIHDTVLAANKAFNRMNTLARQASSYTSHPLMLKAKGIASSVAHSGVQAVRSRPALIGVGVGAAAGAGYDYATNGRSNIRSMASASLKGAALGFGGGLGMYGYRAAGSMAGLKSGARAASGYGRGLMRSAGGRLRSEYSDIMSWAAMGARDKARFGGAMRY